MIRSTEKFLGCLLMAAVAGCSGQTSSSSALLADYPNTDRGPALHVNKPVVSVDASGADVTGPASPGGQAEDAQSMRVAQRSNESGRGQSTQPRSRIICRLLEMLGEVKDEGTPEERKLIREILLKADEELYKSLGENARKKILEANKKPPVLKIRRRRTMGDQPRATTPDLNRDNVKQREFPSDRPEQVIPPAVKPGEKPDALDDVFDSDGV